MQTTRIAAAFLFVLLLAGTRTALQAQNRRGGGRMMTDSSRQLMGRFRDTQPVTPSDLPAPLTATIQKTYPNAELRRTVKDKDGKFYVMLIDASKARKLLVASSNGELLETRDMPAGRGRRGEGQPESN